MYLYTKRSRDHLGLRLAGGSRPLGCRPMAVRGGVELVEGTSTSTEDRFTAYS